jgi:hypothetical protein
MAVVRFSFSCPSSFGWYCENPNDNFYLRQTPSITVMSSVFTSASPAWMA